MLFGVVSGVGLGVGVLDFGGDRRRGGAVLGVNLGRPIVSNGVFATRSSQITLMTCRAEDEVRRVYLAVSNCRSATGLLLQYRLIVHGNVDSTPCSNSAPTTPRSLLRHFAAAVALILGLPPL